MYQLARKSLAIFVLTIMVLVAPLSVLAQDCPPGLVGEDCELYNASLDAMEGVNSFAIEEYTFELTIALDEQSVVIESTGSGAAIIDSNDVIQAAFSFEPGYVSVDGDASEGEGALRFIDNVVYLTDASEQWSAINLGGSVDVAGQTDSVTGDDMLGEDMTMWTRDADIEIDDETMAVFHMDVLVDDLLTSTPVIETLAELAVQMIDDEEFNPALASILITTIMEQFAYDMEGEYTFRVTRYVSLDDLYINYLAVDVNFALSFEFLRGLAPEIDEMLPASGIEVDFQFMVTMDQHNETFDIEPPDEYEDITDDVIEALFSVLESQMADSSGNSGQTGGTEAEFDIEPGMEMTGTLSSSNEQDRYRIVGRAGETVQIALRATDSDVMGLDTNLSVYDMDGNLVAENDDAYDPPTEFDLGIFDSYLEFEFETDGDYIIEVSSVFTLESDEEYTLIVQ